MTTICLSKLTRKEKDHARYIAHREERLEKQRVYYRLHREQCKAKVKECKRRRDERLRYLLQNYGR